MPKLRPKSKSTSPPNYAPTFLTGDCRELLQDQTFERAFDFIFADPPFNIKQDYMGFTDFKSAEEYGEFTAEWMARCWLALRVGGIMCLHGPDDLVPGYLMTMSCVPNAARIAWINWHYRFGQCHRSNWIDARCHCLVYTKQGNGKSHTWNPEAVLVESDRVAYGDKRVAETERGGKRVPGTVWGIPSDGQFWGRVQGNSAERRPNHPNQLPIVYLARLIRAYTNMGDRILDPFCGSGTTAAVSQELQRVCTTIDVSPSSIASARERCTDPSIRKVTLSRCSCRSRLDASI